jgi:hypothetical protein
MTSHVLNSTIDNTLQKLPTDRTPDYNFMKLNLWICVLETEYHCKIPR